MKTSVSLEIYAGNHISNEYGFSTAGTLLISDVCTNSPLAKGFPRDGGFKGDGL